MRKSLWLLGGFLLLSANLHSQVDRGSLTGTVMDSSGLVVPGASVSAAQDATGLRQTTTTSNSGTYAIPELPVGIYTVTFSLVCRLIWVQVDRFAATPRTNCPNHSRISDLYVSSSIHLFLTKM
jgi:hypothetical protein